MVICKFFANGHCMWGDSCRYEHSAPGANVYSKKNLHKIQQQQSQSQNDHYHWNANAKKYSESQNSVSSFSFANTAHNKGSSISTFSFNRATQSLNNNAQAFSFGGVSPPSPTPKAQEFSFSNASRSAKSFSFNQMLQRVESKQPIVNTMNPIQNILQPNSYTSVNSSNSIFGSQSFIQPNQSQPSFFRPTNDSLNQSNSLFSQHTNFGANTLTNPNSRSLFGNSAVPKETVLRNEIPQNISQSLVYSRYDQLSDEDKANYQQPEFQIIPLMPPPYELCV